MNTKTIMAAIGVAGTAAFVGNMLAIGLGFGGYGQSLDPLVFMTWFSENFFRYLIPTVSSVLPFSLIGLGASMWFAREDRPTRRLWIGAFACVLVACLITAVYPVVLALLVGHGLGSGLGFRAVSLSSVCCSVATVGAGARLFCLGCSRQPTADRARQAARTVGGSC